MRFAGDEWFAAWIELTNADAEFRAAGAGWHGSVGLVVRADERHGAVYARLEGAEGQWTRWSVSADPASIDGTTFSLTADRSTWRAIIEQQLDPVRALITGRARIRGQLSAILSRMAATRIMTRRLADLPTEFDADDDGSAR